MSLKTKVLTETLDRVPHAEVVTAKESVSVGEAVGLMRDKGVSCLIICHGKKLIGIFTERDFLMKVAADTKTLSRPISDFMTPDPKCARLSWSAGDAIELMNSAGLRHLPVLDEKENLSFVVTVDGLIRYLADHFSAVVMNRPPEPHRVAPEMDGA
jgi:CBS domain-containing protein